MLVPLDDFVGLVVTNLEADGGQGGTLVRVQFIDGIATLLHSEPIESTLVNFTIATLSAPLGDRQVIDTQTQPGVERNWPPTNEDLNR